MASCNYHRCMTSSDLCYSGLSVAIPGAARELICLLMWAISPSHPLWQRFTFYEAYTMLQNVVHHIYAALRFVVFYDDVHITALRFVTLMPTSAFLCYAFYAFSWRCSSLHTLCYDRSSAHLQPRHLRFYSYSTLWYVDSQVVTVYFFVYLRALHVTLRFAVQYVYVFVLMGAQRLQCHCTRLLPVRRWCL